MSESKGIKRLYKPIEAAYYLGIEQRKLKKLTEKKLIKKCFDGQMYYYKIEDLEAYVNRISENETILGAS